ncbi:hypothetical protein MTO96_004803 [Rhipicephalus appendiculatus]
MQNPMGPHPPSGAPGSPPPGSGTFGRTPSTTVIVNLSREKLNRGGAPPIFPSTSPLPALQNMQRMQQQGMMSMGKQPNLGPMQQASLFQQAGGLGQQASMGAMIPGMQGSLGGLQGLHGLQGLQPGMTSMQQSVPSLMGHATIGAPPRNMSIGVNLGLGKPQQQQPQFGNLLAQQQANANLLGGQRSSLISGQQSGLLATLQAQKQSRMLRQQSSGAAAGHGWDCSAPISRPPAHKLGSRSRVSVQREPYVERAYNYECTLSALMPASSRASTPMLQAMEASQGGSPGMQGTSGAPAIAGTPAPIVMSEPITSAGLAP